MKSYKTKQFELNQVKLKQIFEKYQRKDSKIKYEDLIVICREVKIIPVTST